MGQGDVRTVPLNAADEAPWTATLAGLRSVFDGLSEGVTVQSATGALLYANDAALRILGFPDLPSLLALSPADLTARWDVADESGIPVPPGELPGRAALQGRETPERTVRLRLRATGEERWSVVRAAPLRDAAGRIVGAVHFFRDVTGERRLQERQALLAQASALLGRSLDQPSLLSDLARLCVPALADGCEVHLVLPDGSLRLAAHAHVDPAKADLARRLDERHPLAPDAPSGVPEVVRTGRTLLVRDVTPEALAAGARDDEHRRLLLATRTRSRLVAPLKAAGRVLGAITFVRTDADARRYGPEDAAFAEDLAARAAVSLENARLYAETQAAHARRGAVLDASLDAIITIDGRGLVTEWNVAAERILGWTRAEAVGKEMAELIVPPDLREGHRRGLARLVATGRSALLGERLELSAQRRDGTVFPAELAIVAVPTEGEPAFTGFLRDVSRRKAADEALRFQRTLLAAQMEAVPDAIVIVDNDRRIVAHNAQFERLWGLAPGSVEPAATDAVLDALRALVVDVNGFNEGFRRLRERPAASVRDEVALKDGRVLERYGAAVRDTEGVQHGRVWTFRDITVRRRADETLQRLVRELEAQRTRLDTIIRSVPGVVWETWTRPDPSRERVDFVSDHVETMLGYTRAEWLAAPGFWLSVVHPDDRERVAREVEAQMAAGEGGTLQFRWIRKDGAVLWAQTWNAVVKDSKGQPVGMRGVTLDVTERKRAEEGLARLASIVQDTEDAVYGKSLDGLVTEWNPGAERLYGYAREEIVGQPVQTLVPADLVEEETLLLARVTRGERVPPFETERLRKNGARIHVSLTLSPLRDGSGRIVGASAIARDVSDRKRADRAAARLAAIVRDSEDAIYTKTLDGRVTEWNPGAERLYGWTREEIVGQPIQKLVPDDRVEEEIRMLARIGAGERVEPFETERRRKDGSLIHVSLSVSPLRDPDGVVVGASAVARDISERKRVERELSARAEELAQLAAALERSNRELDQFAYVTSHDLKAPLRGIANLSRWIEEDLGENVTPEARSHLELLRGRVNRMESLIDAILEYSRVGRRRGKVEPVETRRLLEDVVDLLSPPRGFTVRLPEEMPVVVTDRARLQQVFMNLVANAVKHHPDKERGVVSIGVEDAGDRWRFSVADNGRGIPRRFHEKVFAIFQTLEARDKVEGTGIGLAIVKKVVESKGGRVELDSDEGRGATFRFTWPKQESGED